MPLNEFDKENIRDGITVYPLPYVASRYKTSGVAYPSNCGVFDTAMSGGVRGGELIVISGQTGNGKTLYAQSLTTEFESQKIPTLWFTYEMSPFYLNQKFVAMGVDKGWNDTSIYAPIELPSGRLDFISIEIDEAIKTYQTKVVFIDHLHYLIPLNAGVNSSLYVGSIVRGLKEMAVKKNIAIYLLAHTKKIYQDEELSLASIRDSSLIAQEADYVFLVERIRAEQKKKKKAQVKLSDYDDGQGTQNVPHITSAGSDWTNRTKVMLAKNRRTGVLLYKEFIFKDGKLSPL
jgi:replicative DNA helicase